MERLVTGVAAMACRCAKRANVFIKGPRGSSRQRDRPDVRGFDIVHVFNCRIEASFQQQIACCKEAGIPVVVSPSGSLWLVLSGEVEALWPF